MRAVGVLGFPLVSVGEGDRDWSSEVLRAHTLPGRSEHEGKQAQWEMAAPSQQS